MKCVPASCVFPSAPHVSPVLFKGTWIKYPCISWSSSKTVRWKQFAIIPRVRNVTGMPEPDYSGDLHLHWLSLGRGPLSPETSCHNVSWNLKAASCGFIVVQLLVYVICTAEAPVKFMTNTMIFFLPKPAVDADRYFRCFISPPVCPFAVPSIWSTRTKIPLLI